MERKSNKANNGATDLRICGANSDGAISLYIKIIIKQKKIVIV